MFVSSLFITNLYIICVSVCLILIVCIIYFSLKCYLCECVCVYNINIHNLIISKYKRLVTCVYCYHVIMIICYKVSNLKKKESNKHLIS